MVNFASPQLEDNNVRLINSGHGFGFWFGRVVLALLFVILFFAALNLKALWDAKEVYSDLIKGKVLLESAVENAKLQRFDDVSAAASSSQELFSDASRRLVDLENHFILARINYTKSAVSDLKYLSQTGEVLSRAFSRGAGIASGVNKVVTGAEAKNFNEFTSEQKQEVLKLVYESGPELNGIKADLNLSLMNLKKVSFSGPLAPLSSRAENIREQLASAVTLMDRLANFSQILPVLGGYPRPVKYLIVLQNNDELRPTGGFIGTYGILEVSNGSIVRLDTSDVYHLDMPASQSKDFKSEVPAPIKKYLNVDKLYLRDSNWSPDWPTSAKKIQDLYNLEILAVKKDAVPENFDGVIAITPRFITDLLYLTGPITVDGKQYDKDNFQELLQYEVEVAYKDAGEREWNRKAVIGEILKELEIKLFDLPSSRWSGIFASFEQNLARKNILMNFKDTYAQQIVKTFNGTGEIKASTSDYLMVVDANLAAFKSDRVMEKNVDYKLEERQDGLYGIVTINYKHSGGFDWKTTRYRSYTRIYVPLGSWLVKADGLSEGQAEFGREDFSNPEAVKTFFGGFISVEPGRSGTLRFEYRLPVNIKSDNYSFFFQKQAGNNQQFNGAWKFLKTPVSCTSSSFSCVIGDSGYSIKSNGILENDLSVEASF